MSRIRANKITNKAGTGAVELEKGAHLPTGIGITGAGSINVTGVITAASFSGSGAGLTGIDATSIKDPAGNVKIQAQASGAIYTGIHTFGTLTATTLNPTTVNATSLNAASGSFTGNVSIGGTLTYEDVVNVDSVGLVTAREGIFIPDDKKLLIGNTAGSPDLQIFHSAGNSFISHNSSNNLKIQASDLILADVDGTEFFHGKNNAGVDLKHNGNIKLATTNTGVTVTGTVAATAITGDGSGLTGIAVGLTTEALVKTNGQTASLDLSKDDHKVTATGTVTINVTGGSEGDSHSLRIENSGTANVGFSTYFKFPSGATPSLPSTGGAISLISFTVHKAGSVGIATVLLAGASVNFS